MDLKYAIRRSKRKTLSIVVKSNGDVEIKAPVNCTSKYIEEFVEKKKDWIIRACEKQKDNILLGELTDDEYLKAKDITRKKVEGFIDSYTGKKPNCWRIRKQKSVWGTCNSKGCISINALAGLLPDELFEYIMVHELIHLEVLNHNKYFWNLVSYYIPDWKKRRDELKKYRLDG